jgi:outer membrane protein assembly factor BamA
MAESCAAGWVCSGASSNTGAISARSANSLVPVIVKVAEAKRRTVRASAGYTSQDCFRVSAGWAMRNFLGSGRILDISAQASKIGVATLYSAPQGTRWSSESVPSGGLDV